MKRIFHIVALTTVLAMGGQALWAQDFEKGLAATQSGDFATALEEWRPLAEQGNAYAQSNLGRMYAKGEGVTQDYAEAVKWYRKAAEQGDEMAQSDLGVMYANGEGVIQDNVFAHMWFNIAASLGQEGAAGYRDSLAKKMTPEDISQAQKLARECVAMNYTGC